MRQLIKPERLRAGDKIALVSISGGRAGDSDMIKRYETGKRRLSEIFGLVPVDAPNSLRGSEYLRLRPEARAADLMWALKNPEIKGIIANMGGDDSYRLLPYLDFDVISSHPKPLVGYSDITTICMYFTYAGVMSCYGPNLLTPIAQPVRLDEYTEQAIRRTLFSCEPIGEIKPSRRITPIEWRDKPESEIVWNDNSGYRVVQGNNVVRGRLLGGCAGPLIQMLATKVFPRPDDWEDCILFIENGSPYGSALAGLHYWRALDAAGVFRCARGLITGPLTDDEERVLLRFLAEDARRPDLPVLANVDFCHRTPMTILPIGAEAELDCAVGRLKILESAVR